MQSKQTKFLKKLIRILALTLVAVFVGGNIYLWNAQSLTGNAMPMPFGVGAAIVLSGSMEPTLSMDDMIIVRECDEYQVGDVVVFQNGSSVVVHRIVRMEDGMVVTRGDANNAEDAEMEITRIKGLVVGSLPNAGPLVRLMKAPVVSIGLLVLAVFLMERSYRKEKQQGDDELDQIKAEIRRLKQEQENQ